jgi:hypothetical protein
MRIVAEIPHEKYKITLFYHNSKYTLQIESELCTQSYQFRESERVHSPEIIASQLLQHSMLKDIDQQFDSMYNLLRKLTPKGPEIEELPTLI